MITSVQPTGSDYVVSFTSVRSKNYLLDFRDDFQSGAWSTVRQVDYTYYDGTQAGGTGARIGRDLGGSGT